MRQVALWEVIEEQEDGDQQMVHQTQSRGNTGQEAGGLKKKEKRPQTPPHMFEKH